MAKTVVTDPSDASGAREHGDRLAPLGKPPRRARSWLGGMFMVAGGLLCAAACGGTVVDVTQIGGESHFLRTCFESCADGLACISGVCTQGCLVEEASCGELSSAAVCTPDSVEPGAVAVCDVPCSYDADCEALGTQYGCDVGFCRAPLSGAVPDSGFPPLFDDTSMGLARQALSTDLSVVTPVTSRVREVLARDCSSCHTRIADPSSGTFDDFAGLVASGAIVPGASERSPLMQRLVDGHGGLVRLRSPGEVALVQRFIDELGIQRACEPPPFVRNDDIIATLLSDVERQPAEARPFVRYLSLVAASNGGACGRALERQRQALFKLVNSVSIEPEITVPSAVDAAQLLYRIDVRDYGWDRSLDLTSIEGEPLSDVWESAVDVVRRGLQAHHAVEFEGTEADELKRQTTTRVPFLPLNAFVPALSASYLYTPLTAPAQDLEGIRRALGVTTADGMASGTPVRAAVFEPGDLQGTFIGREPTAVAGRPFWMVQLGERARPLAPEIEGALIIYHLPNGIQAYGAIAADGSIGADLSRHGAIDTQTAGDGVSASCQSCHHAGVLPFLDTLRDIVGGNPELYDAATHATVEAEYPPAVVVDPWVSADSGLHRGALEAAGIGTGMPDSIAWVYNDFVFGDLTAERAAAELGVTPAELAEDEFFGLFFVAPGALVSRAYYRPPLESFCAFHRADRNRPVACSAPEQ